MGREDRSAGAAAAGALDVQTRPGSVDVPKTDVELLQWIEHYAGVRVPHKPCCPEHNSSPGEALCHAYFARDPRAVWHASRGYGSKSVSLACLIFAEACTLGCEVALLGGSLEQSQRVHQYLLGERRSLNHGRVFWNHDDAPGLLEGEPTKRMTKLVTGGSIEVLTASQKSVRGPHPQRLRGDEIDEMDRAIWDAAQGQPQEAMGIKEQTVGSSTWQNADGTMTAEIKAAQKQGYPVFRWCYRALMEDHGGWLTEEAVERKRASIPAYMWDTEYDLKKPAVTGRLIYPDACEDAFTTVLGRHAGGLNARVTFEDPVDGVTYAAGGDWAKERDRSIIVVLRTDVQPYRLVYYAHLGRIPFPQMVGVFNEVVGRYEASACHDKTGIGAVIDDYLEVMSEGVVMSGKRRSQLFGDYVVAIEDGRVQAPWIDYMRDEHLFCTVDDVYGAGHPPDSVVAMAMAWRAATGLELFY